MELSEELLLKRTTMHPVESQVLSRMTVISSGGRVAARIRRSRAHWNLGVNRRHKALHPLLPGTLLKVSTVGQGPHTNM